MKQHPSGKANTFKKFSIFCGTQWFITAFLEADQSNPRPPNHFFKTNFNNILPSTYKSSQWSLPLWFPSQNPCKRFFSPPYVLHTPPISCTLIRSPRQYQLSSTDHASLAPHCGTSPIPCYKLWLGLRHATSPATLYCGGGIMISNLQRSHLLQSTQTPHLSFIGSDPTNSDVGETLSSNPATQRHIAVDFNFGIALLW
jgi:hypothetical protein